MKRTTLKLIIFTFLFALSAPVWVAMAQTGFSDEQWRADLAYLQTTVHQDYNSLFRKISAADWDAKVAELNAAIPQMEDHEIMVGLARLVSAFGYGHTTLGLRQEQVPLHKIPLVLYHYDDGVYIQGALKNYEKALGAKILEIEGIEVKEVIKMVRPVVPAENEQFAKAYAINHLTIPEILHAQGVTKTLKSEISLKLEKDGQVFDQLIEAGPRQDITRRYGMVKTDGKWLESRDQSQTPLYLKNLDKIYYFEYLPEKKTVYVRHSQIQDQEGEDIPAFYARLFDFIENNDVEKLILDVRLNGGGNNYKNKPIVTGIIKSEKINQTGKFMVIIGRRTFSACQNLVNELHTYTNAVFVGEPTGENINFFGDNRPVELPNSKLTAYLSFAWWQDKPQWENKEWLAPHISTGITFEQYRTNQDPALEAAFAFNDSNFIRDPMGYITDLFTAGKMDEVVSESKRMINDPNYNFFDFEQEFNGAGYKLLAGGQLEAAIGVFTMNSNFFPQSANVWDSLAEAYWRAGNLTKAEELYNKAISMDPDGDVGANSKEMLAKMKAGDDN